MNGYEPLDVRIEYTLWYNDEQQGEIIIDFDNLEDVEKFKQNYSVHRSEKYLGNLE